VIGDGLSAASLGSTGCQPVVVGGRTDNIHEISSWYRFPDLGKLPRHAG